MFKLLMALSLLAGISLSMSEISKWSAASTKADLAGSSDKGQIVSTYQTSVIDPLKERLDEMDGKNKEQKEPSAKTSESGLRMSHLSTSRLGGRGPSK